MSDEKFGFLTLTRKVGQMLLIDNKILVVVNWVDSGSVSLCIKAPKEIRIDRLEASQEKREEYATKRR